MSKTCALVDLELGEVVNIVMGTKHMSCPEGHILIEDIPLEWVRVGTKYKDGKLVNPYAGQKESGDPNAKPIAPFTAPKAGNAETL
jgi:hypothetical protein